MNDQQLIEDRLRGFVSDADDSDWQEVVRRAGANQRMSVTSLRPRRNSRAQRPRRWRVLLALALAAAVAVPAAAFADDIGELLGLSNQGTPVATSSLSHDTSLERAMQEFGFPSTLHLLGMRDGITFYAAQKPDGTYCFAVTEASTPAGGQLPAADDVGCDGGFPSVGAPVSVFPVGGRFAGFAADGVASVALVDDSGATLATADVKDNLFVGGAMPTGPIILEALDADGHVLSTTHTQPAKVDQGPQAQRVAHLLAFAECMRKHGVPNFPDPNSQGQLPRNSNGPIAPPSTVEAAAKICSTIVSQGALANPGGATH
jgi:hypothetical protein